MPRDDNPVIIERSLFDRKEFYGDREVKHFSPDGNALARVCESRPAPESWTLFKSKNLPSRGGFLFYKSMFDIIIIHNLKEEEICQMINLN